MIKAALEVRELLTYVYKNTENKEYDKIFLSLAEWVTLEHLEKCLKYSIGLLFDYKASIILILIRLYYLYI